MMYRTIFFSWGLLFCFQLTLFAQKQQMVVILNEKIGAIIDAQENNHFHLFDKDIGLIAAKLYSLPPDKWVLHLIGIKEGRPWMYIKNIKGEIKFKLQKQIAAYINSPAPASENYPVVHVSISDYFSTEKPLEIKLIDNTKFVGHIVQVTPDTILFQTLSGLNIKIPEMKITDLKLPKGKLKNGRYWRFDPNNNRLFFAPTGRTLRKGEGNFSDFYVVFPTMAVGLTDFFMLGGGVSIVPGADNQLFYISPKFRVAHGHQYDLALGVLFAGVPGEDNLGAIYSAVSFGDPFGGLTLGLAYPFSTTGNNDLNNPIFILGGETQISHSVKLISENWIITDDDDSTLIFSFGIRFFGEQLAADLGLFTSPDILDEGGFPLFPWVDFAISFGK